MVFIDCGCSVHEILDQDLFDSFTSDTRISALSHVKVVVNQLGGRIRMSRKDYSIQDDQMLPQYGLTGQQLHPVYVIEGIDASGKTSVGPQVAEKIGGGFHEYPSGFKPALSQIDAEATVEARFVFYMSYNLQTSHDILELAIQKPVICVRYLYTTLVYHIVKGLDERWVFAVASLMPLLRPNQVFFLDVSDRSVQMNRLRKRGMLSEDKKMLKKMDEVRSTYLDLARIMPNFTYIDTSYLSKEEVVAEIVRLIK